MSNAMEAVGGAPDRTRVITLQRDGFCAGCGVLLPRDSDAAWDPDRRTTICTVCFDGRRPVRVWRGALAGRAARDARRATPLTIVPSPGAGGRTAPARIGGLALARTEQPSSTPARIDGAGRELDLAAALDRLQPSGAVVLHGRRVPRSRANIDHVVVTSSGVHVIDTRRYQGRIDVRPAGSVFRPGPRQLFVGSRNQGHLIDAMNRHADVVRHALGDLARDDEGAELVHPALCFVAGDWRWFARPEVLDGVRISSPRSLVETIREPGSLDPDRVAQLGRRLADQLEPA